MMKSRLQSIILRTALLLIAVLGTALQTHAYNFEVDGIYYNIISDTDVEVTYKASNEKIYSGAVTIPSQVTHDGKSYTVTRIGLAAFSECSDLTSVTMPITIKTIGYSFYGCTGLERVIIPDSVEGIGNWAFAQCTNLNEVVIGESVAVLGDFAFKDCSNLTKLTVGKSVTYMWCVFNGCNKIKELTWNPKYCERSDCLSTDSLEHLTVGLDVERLPGDLDLDECNALKKLTWNARNCLSANMYKRNITEVILGEEVETLPEDFVRGSKITQITIPTSVKSIGRDAFYRCYSLAKVYISDLSAWMNIDFDTYIPVDDPEGAKLNGGNRDYDDDDEDDEEDPGPASAFCRANPLCYGADLFINNVKKATIVVPDDVTAIKQGVFSGCKTIKTIKIGNHVTSIGSVSFDHCPNLTTVEIGDAITWLCLLRNTVFFVDYRAFGRFYRGIGVLRLFENCAHL